VGRSKTHGNGLTREQIRAAADCPRCNVSAGEDSLCDWSKDTHLIRAERAARTVAGRSHYQRMLAAYGHSPEAADRIADANRPGNVWTHELPPAVVLVNCPVHEVPRGTRCPVGQGYCQARSRKLVLVAVKRSKRQQMAGAR
jgi:hypothetical protein